MSSQLEWSHQEVPIHKAVKQALPKSNYAARAFKVTSGDSGKVYYVQVLYPHGNNRRVFRRDKKTGQVGLILMCQCWQGWLKLPLTMMGMADHMCKHAQYLIKELDKEHKENRRKYSKLMEEAKHAKHGKHHRHRHAHRHHHHSSH